MANVLTDPDILNSLNGPAAASAANGPVIVTDPDQIAHLEKGSAVPADATPGPNGLVWNSSGGYDPKSGELVIAGKPFSDPTSDHPILSKIVAAGEGTLSGVPVAGPTLAAAPVKAAAAVRSAVSGTPVDQTLSGTQGIVSSAEAANPGLTTAGNVVGAVAGTLPLAETALGARGLGLVGGVPARMIQGAGGGAALSTADAYMRGNDPVSAAVSGAAIGAGLPLSAPGSEALLAVR
jgi:hypothetical protein